MHIYKQILLYILNENTIWPSGAIARDIVSQEKNTMWDANVNDFMKTQAVPNFRVSTTNEKSQFPVLYRKVS